MVRLDVRVLVNEIFTSIQGEGTRAGRPCRFIRLTGCPFRCTYCDTMYAYQEGQWMDVDALAERELAALGDPLRGPDAPFIEVTGGEPLAQEGTLRLLDRLAGRGFEVALETAGGHDLSGVPEDVIRIVDRKTPGSGEVASWLDSNLNHLRPGRDELKFVICGEADYQWAKDWCRHCGIWDRVEVLFSAASGRVDPRWLAEAITADLIPVRFQVQLHKLLWDPDRRGV